MKKLILIPHERYQQLLKTAPNSEPVTQSIPSDTEEVAEPFKKEKEVEEIVEKSKTDEIPTDETNLRDLKIPPPPGEPDLVDQTGGSEEIQPRKKARKKNLWETKWTAY